MSRRAELLRAMAIAPWTTPVPLVRGDDGALRPPTPDEAAAHILAHAEALLGALDKAAPEEQEGPTRPETPEAMRAPVGVDPALRIRELEGELELAAASSVRAHLALGEAQGTVERLKGVVRGVEERRREGAAQLVKARELAEARFVTIAKLETEWSDNRIELEQLRAERDALRSKLDSIAYVLRPDDAPQTSA